MKHGSNDTKIFIILSQAWYAAANLAPPCEIIDEVRFALLAPKQGNTSEMAIQWINLNGNPPAKLVVYDDAWNALAAFPDVIQQLGEIGKKVPTPDDIASILKKCGFVDATPRERATAPLKESTFIPTAKGDFGLSCADLEKKHGAEHQDFTRADWEQDVSGWNTSLGYWAWVLHNIESHYFDECDHCKAQETDKHYVENIGYVCPTCAQEFNAKT